MHFIVWHALAAFLLFRVWIMIYNLFFHPLKSVPGPALYALSHIPKVWRNSVKGKHWHDLMKLHEKYGEMVRTGPDEVSCVSAQSWNDIHGFKPSGRQVFARDEKFMGLFQLGDSHLLSNDMRHHSSFRKLIGPGFSDRAMVAQEETIIRWADKLMDSLLRRTDKPIDLGLTFYWSTLDVMGDLTFGESFGCLENNRSGKWLELFQSSQEFIGIFHLLLSFNVTTMLCKLALRLPVTQRWTQSVDIAYDKAKHRLDRGAKDRKDIMSLIWTDAQDQKLTVTKEQVLSLSTVLCLAGMETTSTTLGGTVYWLLKTPHAYERFVKEIRDMKNEEDISLKKLASLTYLNCCIYEGLRLHTPIAGAVPRVVPKGGDWVAGYFLPEGTSCGIPHWATANMPSHFYEPLKYLPERWLGDNDPRFRDEKKDAVHFFAKGPMACIGKHLAMTEMRLFLAKIFWNYDLTLQPESDKWISDADGVIRMLRENRPLMVKLNPRFVTKSESKLNSHSMDTQPLIHKPEEIVVAA